MRKRYFLFLISILSLTIIKAQNLSISGSVTDADKTPLFKANITLLSLPDNAFIDGTSTDMDGNFIIKNLKSGKYNIKIGYLGYETLYLTKEINKVNIESFEKPQNSLRSPLKTPAKCCEIGGYGAFW